MPGTGPEAEIRATRIEYFTETDALCIDLSGRTGVDAQEITDGVVVDLDADGRPVGIELDQATHILDLTTLAVARFPPTDRQAADQGPAAASLTPAS
jgi:uncharacterized protein YuzE